MNDNGSGVRASDNGSAEPPPRLASSTAHDTILRSTVRLARLSFGAAAASVFLLNRERDELVFEAASGTGEDRLIGVAIPPDRGIAGWVASTGETIIVRGVDSDGRFDRTFAEQTGYVPDVILAAPLEDRGDILGVLEVLDPQLESIGDITAIDLLTELANQSCAALSLLLRERAQDRPRGGAEADLDGLADLLDRGSPQQAAAVNDLLSAVLRLAGSPG